MNNQIVILQEWFDKRSKRDRFYLFLAGFIIFYFSYFIVFLRPVIA